jgi:hypothetical protein
LSYTSRTVAAATTTPRTTTTHATTPKRSYEHYYHTTTTNNESYETYSIRHGTERNTIITTDSTTTYQRSWYCIFTTGYFNELHDYLVCYSDGPTTVDFNYSGSSSDNNLENTNNVMIPPVGIIV